MQSQARLPEFLVQHSLSTPTQIFQECWSQAPPPAPPENADLERSWHFGLSWSGPPHPSFPAMQIWTDLATLGWVGLDHHPPLEVFELAQDVCGD